MRIPLPRRLVIAAGSTAAVLAVALMGLARESRHFDPSKLTTECAPCHVGHGYAGTALLPDVEAESCLRCHEGGLAGRRHQLSLSATAEPSDIRTSLRKPFTHGMTSCGACHSVHGISVLEQGDVDVLDVGRQRPSPRRGFENENSMCLSCHGSRRPDGEDRRDVQRLLEPRNASYHPLLVPADGTRSPSLVSPFGEGVILNCSDCHTSDDGSGPRGPHGSNQQYVLGASYIMNPGVTESEEAYRLCYACHDRRRLYSGEEVGSLHSSHVIGASLPCSECHDPHGSVESRALIFFVDRRDGQDGVRPSSSGRIDYISTQPGAGLCYLTCHGVDHDPLGYGRPHEQKALRFRDPGRRFLDPMVRGGQVSPRASESK